MTRVKLRQLAPLAALAALAYFVLLGEAAFFYPLPALRFVNAAVAAVLVLCYVIMAPRRADRIDRACLLALLLLAAAALLAQFPRQAFDALLTALVLVAALFVGRVLLSNPAARRGFVLCLMTLSGVMTFLVATRVVLPVTEWLSLTEWRVIPPLDMNLPAWPWGHRHDFALILVLLYPSWWIGRITPIRMALATVVGLLTLMVVVFDAARAIWLAVAVATVLLAVPIARTYWPRDRRPRLVAGVALAAIVVVAASSGFLGAALERILASESIEARFAMWGPLGEAWLRSPLAGYGPGSFPWVLQTTNYFDTNSFAPRHPDSGVIQTLTEGGMLGLAAVLVVVIALAPAVVRGRSRAARWALTTFAVAAIVANPSEFGFIMAVVVGWTAYAVPHEPDPTTDSGIRPNFFRWALIVCLAAVGVAWTATAIAEVNYRFGREDVVQGGREDELLANLDLAVKLDPGMALYHRQLGIALLVTGDAEQAVTHLSSATDLNPSDDLAWRALSLALTESGETSAGWAALDQAVATQRSDPTNLLLAAMWHIRAGDNERAMALLAEVVQAWPEIVAAPAWAALLPDSIETRDVVDLALARWQQNLPSPEPRSLQPELLALMAQRDRLAEDSARASLGPALGDIYVAVMSCDPGARELLDRAPDELRREALYWALMIRQANLEGHQDERASRIYTIATNARLSPAVAEEVLNPLDENGGEGFSPDTWGYRRPSIEWPASEMLPSPYAGVVRWLLEPREAVEAAGLTSSLPACQ